MSEKILNFSVVLRDAGQVEAVLWRETRDMATVAAIDWVEQGQHHDAIVAENLTHLTALLKVESAAVEKVKPTVRELEEILAQDAADVRAENAEALSPQDQSGEDQSSPQASGTDVAALDGMTQEKYHAEIERETGHAVSCSTFDPEIGVCDCGPNTASIQVDDEDDDIEEATEEDWEPSEQIWTVGGGSYTTETPPQRITKPSPPPSGLDSQAQPQASSEQSLPHDRPALTDTEYQGLQRFEEGDTQSLIQQAEQALTQTQADVDDDSPEALASRIVPAPKPGIFALFGGKAKTEEEMA